MKKLFLTTMSIVLLASCQTDDQYEDLNRDPKNPTQVAAEFLYNSATKSLVDQMTSTNVNNNIFRMLGQHWTETTYTDEANYDLVGRNIPQSHWSEMYRDVLLDLKTAKSNVSASGASEAEKKAKIAQAEILTIYTWQQLVDTFGDIPYSEALGDNTLPAYDDDAAIYSDLITRLDAAIPDLADAGFGSADKLYSGNAASWVKFANSLKLKLGIRLTDVNPTLAQTTITSAVNAGVFTSNADNATLQYEGSTPNTNPVWVSLVQSGRSDFVAANTIVDIMNNLNDPRRSVYFDQNLKPLIGEIASSSVLGTTTTIVFTTPVPTELVVGDEVYNINDASDPDDDLYVGSISAITGSSIDIDGASNLPTVGNNLNYLVYTGGIYGANNGFANYTHIGASMHEPTNPANLMDFAEVSFYLAEAAERSIVGTPADAEGHYNAGITASFDAWGATDVATYLASADVAYTTASGTWREKIGTQFWLAMYNRGFEAWTAWRKYDAPALNLAAISELPVPTRYTYPVNEQNLNPTNWEAASTAIGGDTQTTKVFWDTL